MVYSLTTVILYILVVLIWGSTWLAVKYQIGSVPPEVSVAYRIGGASALMFIWCIIRRLPLKFTLREHLFMVLQGALIFSTNFFLFYLAAETLTTGLIAVIFSTASVMIVLLNSLISGHKPPFSYWFGAVFGVAGIALIFCDEVLSIELQSVVSLGLLLSLGGTFCFSLGSIVSAKNRSAGFSVCGNTAWAMLYGTGVLCSFAFLRGKEFSFDPSPAYVMSLAYLLVIGSVIAFAAYFALLGRIKAEQAAYSTVLFPIVALSLSTIFENYQWTWLGCLGVVLILGGNILVIIKQSTPCKGTGDVKKCK
jgi:drug/metabolite transporter (DMT)-like permease